MSTAKDEPEPRAATDQLARWASLRQGNFSPEIYHRETRAELFDEVLETLRKFSDGKYHVSISGLAVKVLAPEVPSVWKSVRPVYEEGYTPAIVSVPDFSVQPANGLDEIPGFFVYVKDEQGVVNVDGLVHTGGLVALRVSW